MIWEIDIKGAKPETEHQMVKHLEEIGVKNFHMKGYPVQFHTDPRNIIDAVC
jgi:ABC-type oligopeptide transport system ATPase subunit